MRRHRGARSSHLDSPDTVLLWAHRSEQCGYQRGGSAYRAVGNRTWVPPPTAQVNPGASRDLAALSRALLPLPMTPGNYSGFITKSRRGRHV